MNFSFVDFSGSATTPQKVHSLLQSNRGFAYAVLYAAMNVASLLSGWALDLFRITLRDGFGIRDQPADSVLNSGYRLYLVLGKWLKHVLRPAHSSCLSLTPSSWLVWVTSSPVQSHPAWWFSYQILAS